MKMAITAVAIFLVLAVVVLVTAVIQKSNSSPSPSSVPISSASTPPTPEADLQASFQIITQGVVRSFKNPKYHNKSPEVYISADDPTAVQVKRTRITWDDFFKTLPMKLTKDCLTTGDGETFCSSADETLKFYLNNSFDPDLLDREIKDGDKALITF